MNFLKIYICPRNEQDRQRICNLLDVASDIEILGEGEGTTDLPASIRNAKPDILIFDIDRPQGEAMPLLKQIRRENPALEVIALTINPFFQYRRACVHAGAAYFFDKSTEFGKVPRLIEHFVNRKNQA